MFAGQLACEALNWVLKRTIREERPHRKHSLPLSSLEVTYRKAQYYQEAGQCPLRGDNVIGSL